MPRKSATGYCLRQEDGGLPDSMACRIDRFTDKWTVRVFPWQTDSAFGDDMERFIPDNWTIEDPTEYVLWEETTLEADDLFISG